MAKNGQDTKHIRHIARRINLVRNGKECNMYRIYWCEGGLQLEDIATKNVGEDVLDYLYTLRIWFHVERIPGGTGKQQIYPKKRSTIGDHQ